MTIGHVCNIIHRQTDRVYEISMILVVEDDPDSRVLMKTALAMGGFTAQTAAHGVEALEILRQGEFPDLILLDLSLPQMSGEEFIKAARALPNGESLKFVVISGWDDIAKRAQEAGANGYLRKPVDLRILTREVQKHLP